MPRCKPAGRNTKAAREKQLPEANNSVKLPRPKEIVKAEPFTEDEPATSDPQTILFEFGAVRILQLPPGFKGCAVELTRSKIAELSADNPVFKGQKELFHLQEADGAHAYFIVNLGTQTAAKAYFKKKIKPGHPNAQLVLFGEQGKEYLK